jgi:hypothetical protein
MKLNRINSSTFPGTITNAERNTALDNIGVSVENEDWNITQLLSMMPKKKVSKNFDRKMAAAFYLELESEIQQKNSDRIRKKN